MCKCTSIGDRIRISRLQAGMSQEELAKALGRSGRSYISKLELNQREISHGEIKALCEILDVTANYLVFGVHESLAENEQRLLEDFRSLNEEGQEVVLDLVGSLVENSKYKKCSENDLDEKNA
ncbi:MAG: helix-turn-helix domain-containing protein [Ruminiclostridium sp.]